MSTEIVPIATEHEARRITERIRAALDRLSTAWGDLVERVTEAHERRVDEALGYDSWESYAKAELTPSSEIATELRREIVAKLSEAGMSTRAIAPVVGVSQRQVSTDVRSNFSPETEVGPVDAPASAAPRTVTGLDHKTYTVAPKPPMAEPDQSSGEPEVSVIEPATGEIHTEPSFAPGVKGKIYGPKFNQEKAIRNLTHMCEGIVFGTKNISNPTFDSEEASSITASLSAAITSLKQIIKLVKENQK